MATLIGELVLALMAGFVTSDAVTVALPAVFKGTLKLRAPPTNAASAGKPALLSEEVRWMVSLVLTRFQRAPTAFTVTLNGADTACVAGRPVLPVTVPGTEVSPGVRTCSLTKEPGLTVMAGLVLPMIAALVTSAA